jgi:TetR/AcrR family transcriptional regulator, regulator of cefoperazone and chloramphenicol sensitivity
MAGRNAKAKGGATRRATEIAKETTRARLLDAAGEIFAEVGYHRATLREICTRAGVNGALVNYHFGDKLELYSEVLQGLVSSARIKAVRAAMEQKAPPEDILRQVIKLRLRGVLAGDQVGWLFRILSHEIARPTPAMTRIVNGVMRPIYHQLCEVVGAILGSEADSERTRLCAHSVMGQVIIYVLAGPFLSRLWPELKMTPGRVDQLADHISDFSLAYLQRPNGRLPQRSNSNRRRSRP